MNQSTYNKIVALTPMLEQFRSLEPSEQAWLKPLMHKTALTALKILKLIEERERTYEEISDDLQIHIHTVKQILAALEEGGANIKVSGKAAVAETGRCRVLKRVK
jgi:DNA-binding CsgD family transcriptional regulator